MYVSSESVRVNKARLLAIDILMSAMGTVVVNNGSDWGKQQPDKHNFKSIKCHYQLQTEKQNGIYDNQVSLNVKKYEIW